jgi:hypothetical protein
MDSHYHETLVAALIETVATWTDADKDRLASMLGAHCWPGGILDRNSPRGRESVRGWQPGGTLPAIPACSCARGRCAVCN